MMTNAGPSDGDQKLFEREKPRDFRVEIIAPMLIGK